MSSAMNSLRKTKKNPLSPSAVPFRNSVSTRSPATDENQLLDEVTSHLAANRLKNLGSQSVVNISQKTSARKTTADSKTAPSDHELMMLMTNRITMLESRLQSQSHEIIDKDKKIRILEEKLTILQNHGAQGDAAEQMLLERKCLLLQQQIYEMEAFLADYGMVWVGDRSDPDSSLYLEDDEIAEANSDDVQTGGGGGAPPDSKSSRVWKPTESFPPTDFRFDCDQFAKNIHELNVLAGEGIAKIEHTPDGARLKMPEPVQLTLYLNGVLMFNGPFRSFDDLKTRELVKDIIDGYFPSELQGRFPEGVPFKFTDKRNIAFKDRRSEVFQGEGQVLGGETDRSRLIPVSASKEKLIPVMEIETDIPGPKLTMEQFLNRIPKSVVKNGKVIDIRNSVQDIMQGNSSKSASVTVVNTPQLQKLKDRLETNESQRPPSGRQVTTLRIKSEFGDHTYILKMHFADTIGDLRRYLDKERGPNAASYKIMSAFPKTVFADDSVTLFDSGLTPNATLHLSKN